MTTKDELIQIINQSPEYLVEEILNFVLFLRERYDNEELTQQQRNEISQAKQAYELGDYITLEEYEATQA